MKNLDDSGDKLIPCVFEPLGCFCWIRITMILIFVMLAFESRIHFATENIEIELKD